MPKITCKVLLNAQDACLFLQVKSHCLHGMPTVSGKRYIGTPLLIVKMGKLLLFAWGA